MAINRELMKELKEKYGVQDRRIQVMIKKLVEETGDTISREIAALVLAADRNVKISKYASNQEELDRVRVIRNERGSRPLQPPKEKGSKAIKTRPPRQMHFEKVPKVTDPFIPNKIQDEALAMSKIYPLVYIFENSVRNIIVTVLENKYGTNWWELKVTDNVRKNVKKVMNKQEDNPWHGKRGQHEIYYTTIGDLKSIIDNNWKDFKPILRNLEHIKVLIDKIEMSRNVFAHNNPLEKDDIDRLRINFKDWMKLISNAKAKVHIDQIKSS